MINLRESILTDIDRRITNTVEWEAIVNKYRWYPKSGKWEDGCLKLYFGEGVTLRNIEKVAKELNCRDFAISPKCRLVDETLSNIHIHGCTIVDIESSQIDHCSFEGSMWIHIEPARATRLKMTNTDIHSSQLRLCGIDGADLRGCDFDDVKYLTLGRIGPKIEKIAFSWGFVEKQGDNWCPIYGAKPDDADYSVDPLKSLGLDKYKFRNLEDFVVDRRCNYDGAHLEFVKPNTFGHWRAARPQQYTLSSGWDLRVYKGNSLK